MMDLVGRSRKQRCHPSLSATTSTHSSMVSRRRSESSRLDYSAKQYYQWILLQRWCSRALAEVIVMGLLVWRWISKAAIPRRFVFLDDGGLGQVRFLERSPSCDPLTVSSLSEYIQHSLAFGSTLRKCYIFRTLGFCWYDNVLNIFLHC